MAEALLLGGVVGWGVTQILDQVLKTIRKVAAFPEECKRLEARLIRISPLVSASRAAVLTPPMASSSSPAPDHNTGLQAWLRWVEDLLKEAQTLLEECARLDKKSFITKPVKWLKLSGNLKDLDRRIKECALEEAALASLAQIGALGSTLVKYNQRMIVWSEKLERQADAGQDRTQEDRQFQDKLMKEMDDEILKSVDLKVALIHSKLDQIIQILLEQQLRTLRVGRDAPEHILVSRIRALLRKTGQDKRCEMMVQIKGFRDKVWRDIRDYVAVPEPEQSTLPVHRGKARVGGYRVPNDILVQLTITNHSQDDWYFYIITLSHGEGSEPVLFFPCVPVEDCNLLNRSGKRVFPEHDGDYEDDPVSFAMRRSINADAPTDECDGVSLYLVLVRSCPKRPDDPSQDWTVEDIYNHLELLTQEPDSKKVIVKQCHFDILPAH